MKQEKTSGVCAVGTISKNEGDAASTGARKPTQRAGKAFWPNWEVSGMAVRGWGRRRQSDLSCMAPRLCKPLDFRLHGNDGDMKNAINLIAARAHIHWAEGQKDA